MKFLFLAFRTIPNVLRNVTKIIFHFPGPLRTHKVIFKPTEEPKKKKAKKQYLEGKKKMIFILLPTFFLRETVRMKGVIFTDNRVCEKTIRTRKPTGYPSAITVLRLPRRKG